MARNDNHLSQQQTVYGEQLIGTTVATYTSDNDNDGDDENDQPHSDEAGDVTSSTKYTTPIAPAA